MRQKKDNPVLSILTSLRNNLLNLTESFKFSTNVNEDGEGVIFTRSFYQFKDAILKYFKSLNYTNDPTYAKIVTYTNNSVFYYNNLIAMNNRNKLTLMRVR